MDWVLWTVRASSLSKCKTSLLAVESIKHTRPFRVWRVWPPPPISSFRLSTPNRHLHTKRDSGGTNQKPSPLSSPFSFSLRRRPAEKLPSEYWHSLCSCLLEPAAWCSSEQGVKSPIRTPKGHQMLLFISHPKMKCSVGILWIDLSPSVLAASQTCRGDHRSTDVDTNTGQIQTDIT